MKMITVEKFFCCLALETGGLLTGWVCLIINAVLVGFGCMLMIFICTHECVDLMTWVVRHVPNVPWEDVDVCKNGRGTLIAVLIVFMTVWAIGASVSLCLIKGTNNRNPSLVIPFLVMMVVTSISIIPTLFFSSVEIIILNLVSYVFHGYVFVCLYSLYAKFREEHKRGFTAQYQAPGVPIAQHQPQNKV